jgi:hypothetical protein
VNFFSSSSSAYQSLESFEIRQVPRHAVDVPFTVHSNEVQESTIASETLELITIKKELQQAPLGDSLYLTGRGTPRRNSCTEQLVVGLFLMDD